jgi:hypothetical protein
MSTRPTSVLGPGQARASSRSTQELLVSHRFYHTSGFQEAAFTAWYNWTQPHAPRVPGSRYSNVGICQGLVPRVPWAAGYGTKF